MVAVRAVWRTMLVGAVVAATMLCGKTTKAETPEELTVLLQRMERNLTANQIQMLQYTNDELWHNRNFDKHGKVTLDETARYETVFVEGLPYRKKVEENGKPLNGKQAAAEAKRYAQTVAERKQMGVEAKRRSLLSRHVNFDLPLVYLPTLFDNRVVGHEQVAGREAVVVESTPRVGVVGSGAGEQSALREKETTWIDVQDAMPVRVETTQLVDAGVLAGTTFRLDYQRLEDALGGASQRSAPVWAMSQVDAKGAMKIYWMTGRFETVQTFTNYKRFRVDVRLLDDSVQVMDSAPR